MDGWNTTVVSFWVPAYFQGRTAVSFKHRDLPASTGPTINRLRETKLWTLLYSVAWVGHRTDGPTERWFRKAWMAGLVGESLENGWLVVCNKFSPPQNGPKQKNQGFLGNFWVAQILMVNSFELKPFEGRKTMEKQDFNQSLEVRLLIWWWLM